MAVTTVHLAAIAIPITIVDEDGPSDKEEEEYIRHINTIPITFIPGWTMAVFFMGRAHHCW